MRAGDPAEQVEHGQGDRRSDPEQHVEHQHRHGGGQCQEELAGAEASDADQLVHVDEPRGGVHDDGRKAGDRERRQHRPQGEQRQHRARDSHQPAELGALADGASDRRTAAAAADGDALRIPAPTLAAAEGEQLALGVDLLALMAGEGAAGEDVVGVADERDADGRADQCSQVLGGDVGQAGHPQAGRDVTDDCDAVVAEVEDRDDRGGTEHADQRDGRPREEVADGEQHDQRGQAEDGGRDVDLVEVSEHLTKLAEERRRLPRHTEQLAELGGGHGERDAGQVADQHRPATAGRRRLPTAVPSRACRSRRPSTRAQRREAPGRRPPPRATRVRSRSSARSSTRGRRESCRDEPRNT